MNLNRLFPTMLALAVSALIATPATAEVGGMLNGRSADLNNLPDTSVELGINFGEIGDFDSDYQYIGARYNMRMTPDLMAYADLGSMEIETLDEFSFGLGAYYMLRDVVDTADTAIKFSYHTVGGDIDSDFISLEGIVSGRNGLGSNPDLQWYSHLGFTRGSTPGDNSTELSIGFGVAHPTQSGEVFAGIEHVDGMVFGIGYRHHMQ